MGRTGSSSKRKHSKKKSLKVSPEARRLKRSKRTKSKKLRRHDSSSSSSPSSSSSDNDSTTSSPLSSSSSEFEHKTRKSRSRTRTEVKGITKKRTRRRSCSEDDSHSPPAKKRKRPQKKSDHEKKKNNKKLKKKKNKKKRYISSPSSDSESCSTYRDEDSSSDKDKDKDTIKGKSGNSYYYYNDDDNIMVENNPRRLKSIITIATKPENEVEDGDVKKDELKEEMVYDHDYDYPSCKSNDNDSNDDNISIKEKAINDSDNNLESGVDDLESILRKKALENLSRFRGNLQTKPVVNNNDNNNNNNNNNINNNNKNDESGTVIQRSRFTWKRDVSSSVSNLKEEKSAAYSGPESSRSQPNETQESIEVKKSTVGVETPLKEEDKEGSKETNDNSQFEKKTMSVMRGGEMVQVSYKVYIPNRAPALARRQLKR
ncbi:hypothetical protein LXL04_039541 [Taraxacum kok-saghyz]